MCRAGERKGFLLHGPAIDVESLPAPALALQAKNSLEPPRQVSLTNNSDRAAERRENETLD